MENSVEHDKREVPVIEVDERELRAHVSEVAGQSVAEMLNGLLEAKADALCKAQRYESNAERLLPVLGTTSDLFRQRRDTCSIGFRSYAIFTLELP